MKSGARALQPRSLPGAAPCQTKPRSPKAPERSSVPERIAPAEKRGGQTCFLHVKRQRGAKFGLATPLRPMLELRTDGRWFVKKSWDDTTCREQINLGEVLLCSPTPWQGPLLQHQARWASGAPQAGDQSPFCFVLRGF